MRNIRVFDTMDDFIASQEAVSGTGEYVEDIKPGFVYVRELYEQGQGTGAYYNNPSEEPEGEGYVFGDVIYLSNGKLEKVYWEDYNPSMGEKVGLIVVPEGHAPDGIARMIAFNDIQDNEDNGGDDVVSRSNEPGIVAKASTRDVENEEYYSKYFMFNPYDGSSDYAEDQYYYNGLMGQIAYTPTNMFSELFNPDETVSYDGDEFGVKYLACAPSSFNMNAPSDVIPLATNYSSRFPNIVQNTTDNVNGEWVICAGGIASDPGTVMYSVNPLSKKINETRGGDVVLGSGYENYAEPSFVSPYREDGTLNEHFIDTDFQFVDPWGGGEEPSRGGKIVHNGFNDFSGLTWTKLYNTQELRENQPVFAECNDFVTEGTEAGDWYVPAAGEMAYIMSKTNAINDILTELGGQGILEWHCGGFEPEPAPKAANLGASLINDTCTGSCVYFTSTLMDTAYLEEAVGGMLEPIAMFHNDAPGNCQFQHYYDFTTPNYLWLRLRTSKS